MLSPQMRLVAAILVWALLLNSTKWFEWRAVASEEKSCTSESIGRLQNLTSHKEMRGEEQWTIDRSTKLANVSRSWEDNSTLKLTRSKVEVVSGNCGPQVVRYSTL